MSGRVVCRELIPRPCVHERAAHRRGSSHRTVREWLACLDVNGVPGFRAVVLRVPDRTRNERNRRWRATLRARTLDVFGGFCYGCGANGSTPLEFAHVLPTGLSGQGRGQAARHLDVRANPWSYVPLCAMCHKAWGGPERWHGEDA